MKVLVIDDSIVFRTAIKTSLIESSDVEEVILASNGKAGIDFLKSEKFDGITIDLEMPIMDGPETIKAIRNFNKEIPIIIFSGQTINAANKTLHALELGANDFVAKNADTSDINTNLKFIQEQLVPKFKALLRRTKKSNIELVTSHTEKRSKAYLEKSKPALICIGTSTGGPETLKSLFSKLKPGITTPILLVQHMPPLFTTQLASALDELVDFKVKEAVNREKICPKTCYIAPGDFHMSIYRLGEDYYIKLDQSEKVCFVRPSVDVTLDSVAQVFNGCVASIILTGMGNDGLVGTKKIKEKNSIVIIQDESSSTVWGMPKAIYDSGHFDDIGNIDEISQIFNELT